VVPALRPALPSGRRRVRRLPAVADRVGESGFRLSRTGPQGGPPAEVLRLARGGGGPRGRPGRARPAAGRRCDVGAARSPASGRARVRPGSRARAGARTRARAARQRVRPPHQIHRPAGPPDARRAASGDGAGVRPHRPPRGTGSRAPRRRRAHDRRHRVGLRRRPHRRRRPRDPSPDRVPFLLGAHRGTCAFAGAGQRCLYSSVLPSGSVVARGSTPVVDASRGRNDPRKATLGRRAWSGLEVSPAPVSERGSGRGCESSVQAHASGRRRTPPQASVGTKTRSAGREHTPRTGGRRPWI
jgi:hypothetical protein